MRVGEIKDGIFYPTHSWWVSSCYKYKDKVKSTKKAKNT